ncbi:serine hydrolase domain-containing protein [Cognatiyoonia sp. IB215446]|uniref:serine hydrolase domain-containing protein n=1 Tax=Cognatiyoonia sp. IB215446 TaxID=3097355 RepID=UPI002A0CF1B0|nr:serine hydrolase domain-containing protein [Cognatiyoonia sp. IB215446]MDX8347667.1 serine hydrolase domain-containing protein [Cognatiyoonia sp. IB215446]
MLKIKKLITIIAAAWVSVTSLQAQETNAGALDADQITQLMADFDIPGLAMATLQDCTAEETITLGKADLATGADVTRQTAFEAASLTKPVFAYLVMTLVADGIIDLDTPIAADFNYPRIDEKDAYSALTPRMILTHRTGLPNWVDEGTDFHQRTATIPFEAMPGERFTYSGEAFQLLQAYVEAQAGQSVRDLFVARLGEIMPNSTLQRPLPGSVLPSRGYQSAQDPESGRGMTNLYDKAMVASSLATTIDDYTAFLAHICAGKGLPPDLYAEMIRPQSPAPDLLSDIVGAGPAVSWSLGWMTIDFGQDLMVGHGGNNDEYNAFAGFFRDAGDGIVILTNGANGQALIEAFLLPDGT